MKIRLIGYPAQAYVNELGGSLEVHAPDASCPEVYFDANIDHPDHQVIMDKIRRQREAFEKYAGPHRFNLSTNSHGNP